MESNTNKPITFLPSTRHDGWTGEAMAIFLETLVETGVVMEACDAAGKSSPAAYALRRRNPLFAQAWELALGNARDRLADTLLARSIEGNVEQIIKDGEIVAEKHFLDNRLGLAILKRLDQRTGGARRLPLPAPAAEPDWDVAITALRTGKENDLAAALAMLCGTEVSEVSTTPIDEFEDSEPRFNHPRIWHSRQTDEWCTNFPPPPGYKGDEDGDWEDEAYCRSLSDEEMAALVAAGIAERKEVPVQVSIEEDEAERTAFFESLAANSPGSAPKNEIVSAQSDA